MSTPSDSAQFQRNHLATLISDAQPPAKKRRRRAAGGGAQDDCFACRKRAVQCDRKRPYCTQCINIGKECSGYKTTLTWGVGVASRGKLRGMSLPVMGHEQEKVLLDSPTHAAAGRRQSSSSRARNDITSEGSGSSRARRPSRQSLTSHPISIKPAIAPAQASSVFQDSSWASQSSPHSSLQYGSFHATRTLQRLQTTIGPYSDDGNFSDSASSTGSFFEADYLTPIEYISEHDLPEVPGLYQMPLSDQQPFHHSCDPIAGVDQIGEYMSSTMLPNPQEEPQQSDTNRVMHEEHDDRDVVTVQPNFYNPFSKLMARTQFLFQYYDANICPFLVAYDGPQNPYRTYLLQMALQNESLQNALAALATNNMRIRRLCNSTTPHQRGRVVTPDSLPDAEETMYKQASVEQLNRQLADPVAAQDDSVLATLLVLCLFHVCDSGFSKFRTQLAGVQKLLSLRQSHQRSTFTDWVEMFFMWFDVMTSAVNDREMEVTGDQMNMLEYSANLGSFEQFSGCDGRLFKLLARLSRLNLLAQGRPVSQSSEQMRQLHADSTLPSNDGRPERSRMSTEKLPSQRSLDARDYVHLDGNGWGSSIHASGSPGTSWTVPSRPAPDSRTEFWAEWHDIRARLQDWQMDLSALSASICTSDADVIRSGTGQGDMMHISESFRYAALLYTERLAHPLLPSASHQFQQHVTKALLHITALPVTSCVNKFLLWPLFLAGTECVDASQHSVIRSRCIEIQRESGFYNNLSGLDVLERVWSDVDVGHNDAGEMKARKRDSEYPGAGPLRQAFRWRLAMDRTDGEYLLI